MSKLKLDIYAEGGKTLDIRPAPPTRDWMDATPEKFAYRCLPLSIANGHAWEFLCPSSFVASWTGGSRTDDIIITPGDDDKPAPATSHFGAGVLTFHVPCLIKTPPGYDLWVSGPANRPKMHIQALTGIIETDWSNDSFTMNWMFTTPGSTIKFEQGEPFCAFFPIARGVVEQFQPQLHTFEEAPELWEANKDFKESRGHFLKDLKVPGSESQKIKWQKKYFQGPKDEVKPPHRTKLKLKDVKPAKTDK